jgi:uracil-DNA glycosylase
VDSQAFWHTVAFYNYIQCVVGGGARIPPTKEMWTKARPPFSQVLKMLAPHAILVLGKRLWNKLPEGTSTTLFVDGQSWPARTYGVADGVNAVATFINHPASRGFSAKRWTPIVAALLDQGRSRISSV